VVTKPEIKTVEKPTFKEAFLFWLRLGFISFGGPAGQIAIMHEFLVDKKKWISNSKFLHALNYCMILPGPEAQQLAIYTGWLLHGKKGGLAAGILFVLPSVFILLGLSCLYVTFGKIPWVYSLFYGLKPAVVAIVILALIKIGKKSLNNWFAYLIALLSFICIFFLKISFPLIILGGIVIGFLGKTFFPEFFKSKTDLINNDDEEGYYINANSIVTGVGFNFFRLLRQLFTGIVLWSVPIILFYYFTSDFKFWSQLSLFFTQAAFVTFGGAYSVLPYVTQVSVEKFSWLSSNQMIDGLALGETTPGPLIMVLAFVGFMGGYNHFAFSISMGALALFTTVYFTFMPCFLFVFIGAPIIERTQHNLNVKAILSLVTATVTGVILNLTVFFAKAVVFTDTNDIFHHIDYFCLSWILISFIVMYKLKIGMIPWIGISALAGLAYYLIMKEIIVLP
jgi:chromate transporter